MKPLLLLTTVAAAMLLSACVNQNAEVREYRKVLDGAHPTPATLPADAQMLPLEDALRIANADNDQLQIEGEDYVQALIAKARAAETFLPSISFAPTMMRQEDFKYPNFGAAGGTGGAGAGASFQQFFPQNYSDVPINTSLRTSVVKDLYDVSRAAKTVAQRKALLLDLQSAVLLNVSQTYYGILESEQSVRTLTASVAVQEKRA